MRPHYLALVALGDKPLPQDAAIPPQCGLDPLLRTPRLALWSQGRRLVNAPDTGAVVGELFDRGASVPECELATETWASIKRSQGRELLIRFWGSYVSFLVDRERVQVLRSPFGDVGCIYAKVGDVLAIASSMSLLRLVLGRHPVTHPLALARHIAFPDWRGSETCLEGVQDLRGGGRLTIDDVGFRFETLWTPWTFASRERQLTDQRDAMRSIREAVRVSVLGRSASCRNPLLLLSGGLDSSIVAAALHQGGRPFTGLNLSAPDAASDERTYAMEVANLHDREVLMRSFDPSHIDIERSGASHMTYPGHRSFTQAIDAAVLRDAEALGSDAVLDGGGGDNVFFSLRSVAILADCLLDQGFGNQFGDAVRALGDLAQASNLALGWKAIHRAWLRRDGPRRKPNLTYLSSDARSEITVTTRHPWFQPPKGILPGRASHVSLLVPAQNLVEGINAQAHFPSISPLVSQPVVEACLRVPSCYWIAPGLDRAAARLAFQDLLPASVFSRRSKGSPNAFVANLFDARRGAIRALLLDGRLSAMGLLDRGTLEAALTVEGPTRGYEFVRIMDVLDAEVWARSQC